VTIAHSCPVAPGRSSYPRPPTVPDAGSRPNSEPAPTSSSVRLKDGEREIEVSGPRSLSASADDLPTLLAAFAGRRLRPRLQYACPPLRQPAPRLIGRYPRFTPVPEVHAPVPRFTPCT